MDITKVAQNLFTLLQNKTQFIQVTLPIYFNSLCIYHFIRLFKQNNILKTIKTMESIAQLSHLYYLLLCIQ